MQPVQLEKAISNPDLRAGKVRQRSVATAENTEVAGECAVCTLHRGRGLFIYDDSISYDHLVMPFWQTIYGPLTNMYQE